MDPIVVVTWLAENENFSGKQSPPLASGVKVRWLGCHKVRITALTGSIRAGQTGAMADPGCNPKRLHNLLFQLYISKDLRSPLHAFLGLMRRWYLT
jgi:hypothetical protein